MRELLGFRIRCWASNMFAWPGRGWNPAGYVFTCCWDEEPYTFPADQAEWVRRQGHLWGAVDFQPVYSDMERS